MAKKKKKGKGLGLITLLAVAALGSGVSKDNKTVENASSIPVATKEISDSRIISPSPEVSATLPPEIDVQALIISPDSVSLSLGEKKTLQANITPKNATDKTIFWKSSNNEIATINNKGEVTAVLPGSVDIIATTSNGISSTATVQVDGSKRTVTLKYGCSRLDSNNIGKEWSYQYRINGEAIKGGNYTLTVGDVLNLSAEFTEADTKPDIGKASVTHTVTESDLINGFTEEMNLTVTENAGKNTGKSAQFVVKFEFIIN